MTEQQLMDKLRKVEALFAGAASDGERDAAAYAIEKIRERLKHTQASDPPIEYKFTLGDVWSRKLFIALLRRYGMSPYRYRGQRHTTVMVRVSRRFVDETLWPEYTELCDVLRGYLDDVTERVISGSIFADSSDAEVRAEPTGLPAPAFDHR
jgi:hypothetical protein